MLVLVDLVLCGSVVLVGVGLGDLGLFILCVLCVMNEVDVILYDCLVSVEVLVFVCCDVECIEVVKEVGYYYIM